MMRALIQSQARTVNIKEEADRVGTKYNPKTSQDLERIAKEEYGVKKVVKTPLVLVSGVVVNAKDGLYIFYNASFESCEPFVLGHEIGHIAAGHFNGKHQPGLFTREFEADYFSQLLNGISPAKFYSLLTIEGALMVKQLVTRSFGKKREVEILQDLEVYHLLRQFPSLFYFSRVFY